jgi:SSS family transporter
MGRLDLALFGVYLVAILLLGALYTRRRPAYDEYFLAGRTMHWFPIGLSIMVTAFSAINYTGFAGEVAENGSYVLLALPVYVLVIWPVTRLVMPLYHAMRIGSAYEYLERRFDVRVRTAASALFILWRLLWMATLIWVPCKVLGLITGLDHRVLVLLAGGVTAVYTLLGGMRAVMWTDVAQFFVLIGSVVLGVGVAAARHPGGLGGMLHAGLEAGLGRPFVPFSADALSFDPTVRITLWSCWLGTFVAFMARYGADQVVVQHYFAARSLRHARVGFVLNVACAIAALLLLALFGVAIFCHVGPQLPGPSRANPIVAFSSFVRSLPAGVPGLIVAGLFAATMSSVSSGINSCAAALVTDFYRRGGGVANSGAERQVSRAASAAVGAAASGLALVVGRLGSVFEIANRIINGMGAPLLALFAAGLLCRWANRRGALVGALAGTAASAYTSFTVAPLSLHYYAVVNLAVTLALILAGSLVENRVCGPPTPAQLAWTWSERTWLRRPADGQPAGARPQGRERDAGRMDPNGE